MLEILTLNCLYLFLTAYCSSVLFNKENGILKFLKETATLEEFVGCKEKLLELLGSFVGILDQKILSYALEIKVGVLRSVLARL